MTKKHPAEAVQDLLASKLTGGSMDTLADSAELVGGINDILKDPALAAALETMEGEQAIALKEAMASALQMEDVTKRMVEAEEAGDMDALSALTEEFSKIAPNAGYAPEHYDPPYDAIDEAIVEGNEVALVTVLKDRPDLNVPLGRHNSFPLSAAAMSYEDNRGALIKLLLDHGADAAFATPDGHTALHALVDSPDRRDTVSSIALLLKHGADIEARNSYGWTPLLAAVMEGTPLVIQTLLTKGANVHVRFGADTLPAFARGCTAMMCAAGEPDKIKLLLAHGADPAGAHDDGRGFNAYADDIVANAGEDQHEQDYAAAVDASRILVNAARLN